MASLQYHVEDGIGFITFDTPDSKVNILSAEALGELSAAIARAGSESGLKALILRSAKKGIFIAGADIKEIDSISDAATGESKARSGQAVFDALEDLPFPTVALMNGTTLGGGLEMALAASYRFAAFGEGVQIGLPEVKLGIIPGFGGTWRLPARTGLQKGLEWITQGKTGNPVQARSAGIVDGLAAEGLLQQTALDFLKKTGYRKGAGPQRKRDAVTKFIEDTPFGRAWIEKTAHAMVLKNTKGQYPAPLAAVHAVVANWRAPRETALKHEAKEFGKLVAAGTHKSLIRVFYLTERYKKEKWTDAKPAAVQKAATVGAGVMGGGIAQIISASGTPVRLKDVNAEAVMLGLRSASQVYKDTVHKKRLTRYEAETRMGMILPSLDYSGFKRADIVIEAVVENLDVKKKVFAELDKNCGPQAILASNTSSLPVSRMADAVQDPGRVVGMHFFNPVSKMPLVEIIRGEKTSESTIATVVDFSRRLKKTVIVVKDAPGFLVNRLLLPFLNEAGFLFEEGETPERVDRVLLDFGMPMGAFWLLDEIGLDVAAKVSHVLHDAFGERMKPCPAIGSMVEKKWLGKKSGTGFYAHEKVRKPNPNLAVPPLKAPHDDAEIIDRCVLAMVNEAARCLEEKVVREAADVDIGMIMGAGFPPFRGGLLRYADSVGADRIVSRLKEFETRTGSPRFRPAPLLIEMQKSGSGFYAS